MAPAQHAGRPGPTLRPVILAKEAAYTLTKAAGMYRLLTTSCSTWLLYLQLSTQAQHTLNGPTAAAAGLHALAVRISGALLLRLLGYVHVGKEFPLEVWHGHNTTNDACTDVH